jgi:hypothetical protein
MKLFDEVVILSLASDPDRLLPIAEGDLELACSELLVEARARLPEVAARVERDAVLDESDRAKVNALLAGAFASAKGV